MSLAAAPRPGSVQDETDAAQPRKRILSVGMVCLDLITVCRQFPAEDSETLAADHYWARGGNASNTAAVLAPGAFVSGLSSIGAFVAGRFREGCRIE